MGGPHDQADEDGHEAAAQTQGTQMGQGTEREGAEGSTINGTDDNRQKEHDGNTPKSEHAGSTQNSRPWPVMHIDKAQGHGKRTTT